MPSSAQVRYYFDHNSGPTEPILMIFFKYAQSNYLQQCLRAFFLYLSYLSRFSQKTSQAPQFDHFLTTFLPISPDSMGRFCSSLNLASQIKIEVFYKKIHQNRFRFTRVIVMTDRQTGRQTDGRNFFFAFLAYLGLDRWSAPT